MKKLLACALASLLASTATTHAQVVLWNDDFDVSVSVTVLGSSTPWTEGTDSLDTYYSKLNNPGGWESSGGVGGTGWLNVGLYGDGTILALAGPVVADTWTVDFDWQSTSAFGATNFTAWGLTSGQTLGLAYQGVGGGTATNLFTSPNIPNTGGIWTSHSYSFSVPTGYNAIVLKWGHDLNTPRGGIDNLVVTSAIPEPSTWALLGLGLGLLAWSRRKR